MECESQVGKPGIQIILSYEHAANPCMQVSRFSWKMSSCGTQEIRQHPEHMLLNNLFIYCHRTSVTLTAPTQHLRLLFLQKDKTTQDTSLQHYDSVRLKHSWSLVYSTMPFQLHMLYSTKWYEWEWWIVKDMEGSSCCLLEVCTSLERLGEWQAGWPVAVLKFKPRFSWIWSRHTDHYTTTFGHKFTI